VARQAQADGEETQLTYDDMTDEQLREVLDWRHPNITREMLLAAVANRVALGRLPKEPEVRP
jgi:hypothetical protein